MKILLFGKNGQLGWELQRALSPLGELIVLDRSGLEGLCGDLSDLAGLRHTINAVKPDVIVNAAAYTAVDQAESEPELAHIINAQAPKLLAQEAIKINALLVHYSTDYVFNGEGSSPWCENDTPAPLNQYGQSKRTGEQSIQTSGCKHLIFRTSWVYGNRGNNFAKTMLRLAKERQTLSVIHDQVGTPTSSALLADCTVHAIYQTIRNPKLEGMYHVAASGTATWYEYARFVIENAMAMGAELAVTEIKPICTSDYPTIAKRPHNSRLNTTKFCDSFNLVLPEWQYGVMRVLQETINK